MRLYQILVCLMLANFTGTAAAEGPTVGSLVPLFGITMTRFSGSEGEYDRGLGYAAGATMDIGSGFNVISTGFIYSRYCSIRDFELKDKPFREAFVNDYLGFVIQGKLYPSVLHEDFYLRYGLLVNVLMNSEYQYVNRSEKVNIERYESEHFFNSVDPMGSLGIGIKSIYKNTQYIIDWSYSLSMRRITAPDLPSWHNEVMMITAAFGLFP